MCLGILKPLFSPKSQTSGWSILSECVEKGWGVDKGEREWRKGSKWDEVWGLRWERRKEGVPPCGAKEKTKA